jgi:hypothetical protein
MRLIPPSAWKKAHSAKFASRIVHSLGALRREDGLYAQPRRMSGDYM